MGLENMVIGKVLGFVGKRLDGYKTKIGGVGLILIGIAGGMRLIFPDQIYLPDMTLGQCTGAISSGFVALGLGHKMEKQTQAINVQTQEISAQTQVIKDTANNPSGISPQ